MSGKVTRPGELLGASSRVLLDAFHDHIGRLVDARSGIGRQLSVGRLRAHALDALAVGEALAQQMLNMRWTNVLDALSYGATVDDTAAAMGLDVDEVQTGLRSWADGQFREGLATRAQYDAVLALVDGGEVTR